MTDAPDGAASPGVQGEVRDARPRTSGETREQAEQSTLGLLRDLARGGRPSRADAEGLWGAIKDVARAARDVVSEQLDADRALMHAMSAVIETAKSRYALDPGAQWKPGEPLKLLLAGYNGTRNTGADVRVEEMIRQFRHLFGDEHVELSIYTIDPDKTRGYFRTVRQLHIPKIFPRYLFDTVHTHHAVVACEGSMFKSKFASALSTMMVGSIGLAAAEQKLAIGYGGEAGDMDEGLRALVERYCREALILARNRESQEVLRELGIASKYGTDTAWTFTPAPDEVGQRVLRDAGWDGVTPVLALCPINPFWWPVKPDVTRAAVNAVSGMYADGHYGSVYFHREGADVHERQERYLDALAEGVRRFRAEHDVFPVMIGSEMLDREACEGLRERLGAEYPVIVSDEHDMYDMVSIMRQARLMLSSRYHAIVTTMPAGLPSAGVTMDERIRNLMADRGTPELALEVDDPELADKVHTALVTLYTDAERIRASIDGCVLENLERMGQMGMDLVDFVRAHHPEFPFADGLGHGGDPFAHLPSLPPRLAQMVAARHAPPVPTEGVELSRPRSVA
ncbi:MAG: polysaccharide pyruvyl transferase family protein [Myxococcales bacterium]|nr:polysaccharide pyruvyl transferase family protein [Myxococcales bacterium]MCB9628786.1 polysaccharide pyruvyl transferase family protein [Sandaracinaceae bacterium]